MNDLYIRRELGGGASLEIVRQILNVSRPTSARALMTKALTPLSFEESLVTSDGVALGGSHRLTVNRDGSYVYEGHLRATGWPSYDVSLTTHLIGAAGFTLVFPAQATVHGTNESGDREARWRHEGQSSIARVRWFDLQHARLHHDLQYDSDLFGTIGDIAEFAAKAVATYATAGSAGVIFFAGSEAISALDLPELALPGTIGIIVGGAVLLVGGRGAYIPALVAGASAGIVVAAAVRQSSLSDSEYALAVKVYGNSLPRERILKTNLQGLGGRPFTIPAPGNVILLNLGDGFEDADLYDGFGQGSGKQKPGQLLIHELAHAWQIEHSTFLPGTLCAGLFNQVGTLGGDMSVYQYTPAGPDWNYFNLEQQASIVDDWFAGTGSQQTYGPCNESNEPNGNPYWRYIQSNVRPGVT